MATALTVETVNSQDVAILRELARQYLEICAKPSQQAKRKTWRALHAKKPVSPPIYVRACAWHEMPQSQCQCQDRSLRQYEDFFRRMLFQDTLGDDYIFEPWVTVRAAVLVPEGGIWGLRPQRHSPEQSGGAWKEEPPLKTEEDLEKLKTIEHRIDEPATARAVNRLQEILGDLITINVDRGSAYGMWRMDLSSDLGGLRGIENIMWDMMDRPEWLHRVMAKMRDGVLRSHQQAEASGDWRLCNHQNQSMAYAESLADPAANSSPTSRKQLWCFSASQELTLVGPAQFDEFMLQYQIPIMEQFGLSAYGCCEDLTTKIPLLRRVRNLRRIAVAPRANVAKCAEQIGKDYVISYRPSPADMVAYDFSPERVRSILQRDLACLKNSHFDITLKDVETVERDPERVRSWTQITREMIAAM